MVTSQGIIRKKVLTENPNQTQPCGKALFAYQILSAAVGPIVYYATVWTQPDRAERLS